MPTASPERARARVLITLIGALALVFVLSTMLSTLELQPAHPYDLSMRRVPSLPGGSGTLAGGGAILVFMRAMLALSVLALPVYVVMSIMTKDGRKRLLVHAIVIGGLLLLTEAVQRSGIGKTIEEGAAAAGRAAAQNSVKLPPLPEFPGVTDDTTVLVATIIVALVLVGIAASVLWVVYNARRHPPSPFKEIADEAQQAIDSLRAGDALEETIQRCYLEMCAVLQGSRGVRRALAMTPAEFERALAGQSLPAHAVGRLTRLFEGIRYGAHAAGPREQQLAIECLADIVSACSKGARSGAGSAAA